MKKYNYLGIPVGTSLLIVVMMLISMVAFSTISFVSANRDYKLSEDIAISTQEFYNADCIAQEKLMIIDETLHELYKNSSSQEDYFKKVIEYPWEHNISKSKDNDNGIYIAYNVNVNDKEQLRCKIKVQYPKSVEALEIISWKLEYQKEWNGNSTVPVLIK